MQQTVAFWCFFAVAFFWVLSGFVYLFSPRLMPYHLEALGGRWDELPPEVRLMLLMFLKGGGAGMLAAGAALFIILFIPFGAGEPWARWAFLAVSAVGMAPLLYVMRQIGRQTPASPPWQAVAVMALLVLTGFLLS